MASKNSSKKIENNIPSGWVWTTLGEIALINFRDPQLHSLPDNLSVTFVPMAAVDAEQGVISDPEVRSLSTVKRGYKAFSDGDVLFAKITPSMENGKAAIAKDLKNGLGFGSTEFHILKPLGGIIPEWLFLFVRQESFRQDAKAQFSGTAGQLRVPERFITNYSIPLAPLPEQQRIVDEIERLFTRGDAGVAALERVQKKLERYKTSMLKAACEGELVPTEAELAQQEGREYEPAEVMLERILEERRKKWEAEEWERLIERAKKKVAKDQRKAAGLPHYIRDLEPGDWEEITEEVYKKFLLKDDKWKDKYVSPVEPDLENLWVLPDGWVWATLDQMSYHVTSGSRGWAKYYAQQGSLFVRVGNFNRRSIDLDLSDIVFVTPPEGPEVERTRLILGDLLMTITADVGMVGAVDEHVLKWGEAFINQHVSLVRFVISDVVKFVGYACASEIIQDQVKEKQYGATKQGLNLDDVKKLCIPLPPLAEQKCIIEELETKFPIISKQKATYEINGKKAIGLRQTILRDAFEGKLVPQNPKEEPASELLSRIQTERESREKEEAKKPKPKRRKKVASTPEHRSLFKVLVEAETQIVPEDLFRRAGFDENFVDEFYKELHLEIESGRIEELRPNEIDVYLRVEKDEN